MRENVAARAPIGFAHRGARAHAPENTLEAFAKAMDLGAKALETDVWLSADSKVIIDHDGVVRNGLRRTPIAHVEAKNLPKHMPTLQDLHDQIDASVELSIDVKNPDAAPGIVAIRATKGPEALRRTWLCDSDPERLATWRRFDEDIRLVASLRRRHLKSYPPHKLADLGMDALNLPHRQWRQGLVEECHECGLRAFAWGIQRSKRMERVLGWGVDAIFSDHSDRMAMVLQTLR